MLCTTTQRGGFALARRKEKKSRSIAPLEDPQWHKTSMLQYNITAYHCLCVLLKTEALEIMIRDSL